MRLGPVGMTVPPRQIAGRMQSAGGFGVEVVLISLVDRAAGAAASGRAAVEHDTISRGRER